MFILDIDNSTWFDTNKDNLFWTLITVVAVVILYYIVKFIASRFRKKASNRAKSLTYIIQNFIGIVMFVIAFLIILNIWGFDTGIGLFISCATALVIGIGAHDIISDVFNGVSNTFASIYDLDDIIEINGFKGKVINITLTKTTLQSVNGEIKTISSSKIKEVTNFSKAYSNISVEISVDYEEEIDDVINLLEEKLPSLKEEYTQILEGPIISGIEDVDANNVILKISAKTTPENHMPVSRGIRKKVINLFKEHKIKFGKKDLK